MRPVPVLLVACCLLLSGCGAAFVTPTPKGMTTPSPTDATATSAPTATPEETTTAVPATSTSTATPTPAPQGYVAVEGGTLPVNATLVWVRTRALLRTDAPAPSTVEVRNVSVSPTPRASPFFQLWGLVPPNRTEAPTVAAYVTGPARVYVNRKIRDRPALLEHTLAHEYTHVVQYRTGVFEATNLAYGPSPDGQATRTAVIEGSAVVVGNAYWRMHMTRGTQPAENIRQLYRNSTGAARWAVAPYWFGYRYVSARANASSLPRVYDDLPNTTEEVLHPGIRDAVVELNVTADETDAWSHIPGNGRMGELFVRVALSTELSESRAAAGSDGWGADMRVAFVDEAGGNGYAWVLRFDDRPNATEFVSALKAYLRERGATRAGDVWVAGDTAFRRERIDPRTVVVFAGERTFVGRATARAANATIHVSPPN